MVPDKTAIECLSNSLFNAMNIKNLVLGTTLSVFGSAFSSLPLMALPLSYNGWQSVPSRTVGACVLQAKNFLKSRNDINSVESSGPGAYGTYKNGENVVIFCSPQGDQALMIVTGSSDAQSINQILSPDFFKQ